MIYENIVVIVLLFLGGVFSSLKTIKILSMI